jgi:hypothetical protein
MYIIYQQFLNYNSFFSRGSPVRGHFEMDSSDTQREATTNPWSNGLGLCDKGSRTMLRSFSTSENTVPAQCATAVKAYKYIHSSSQFARNREALSYTMWRELEYWRFNYRLSSYPSPWPQHVVPDNWKHISGYHRTADVRVHLLQAEI